MSGAGLDDSSAHGVVQIGQASERGIDGDVKRPGGGERARLPIVLVVAVGHEEGDVVPTVSVYEDADGAARVQASTFAVSGANGDDEGVAGDQRGLQDVLDRPADEIVERLAGYLVLDGTLIVTMVESVDRWPVDNVYWRVRGRTLAGHPRVLTELASVG